MFSKRCRAHSFVALEEGAKMGLVLEPELVGYLLYGHRRRDKKCFGALHDSAFDKRTGRNAECLFDGARIAANTANLLPDYFSAVGLFSPVVHKEQLPKDSEMYYVYTGKKDFFHGNAKRFKRRLEKAKVPHEYTETIGGHTWRNWRLYLSKFLNTISTKDSL